MAGGGGTRLWPLSRQSNPKQMLQLSGERSLFQTAVDRLEGVFPPQRIFIVTVADQAARLQEQCPEIPAQNYLLEPMPRGTASVVGMAALALRAMDPQATMAVLTADHFIENIAGFRSLLQAGYELAQEGYLVTLGIQPTYPATGYGYIQRGESIGEYQGNGAFRVLRFKEKPDEAVAQQMLDQGDHDWNSGMFMWTVERIWNEIHTLMPELAAKLDEIAADWGTDLQDQVLQSVWPTIKPETVDYGIMEKADRVAVLSASGLGWNDVGSWESLFDVLTPDENGNIVLGANHVGLETTHSLVCANQSDRLIVTIGARDLIIVDTGDALMVCPRDDSQKVRQMVNLLKQMGRHEYL
ncbi:MAG: sugar phosphate nucleotidyltransferase [Anaerolineaceae bacterium]|nr:sugar phosphate nucleotidyltransferase [Anaerolineaceae bacterium]